MFESVEEVDQIETEPKSDEAKQAPKVSNMVPQNGNASPDSGHPSSRNFSVTSGRSDSLSTEDSGAQELSARSSGQMQPALSQTVAKGIESDGEQISQTKAAKGSEGDEARLQGSAEERTEKISGSLKDKGELAEAGEPPGADTAGTETETASKEEGASEQIKRCEVFMVSNAAEMPPAPGSESLKDVASNKMLGSEDRLGARPKTEEAQLSVKRESRAKEGLKEGPGSKKAVMQTAPVVEETVVPIVFEAFSTRKMSETPSDESPSAIEMEDIPTARVAADWDRQSRSQGKDTAVPTLDGRGSKVSPEGAELVLSDEPQMESLYPQFDSLTVAGDKNGATSPVSSIGTTYSVSIQGRIGLTGQVIT